MATRQDHVVSIDQTQVRQRNKTRQTTHLPFQLMSISKHWRWYHMVTVAMVILSCIEVIVFIISTFLLIHASDPIRFDIQHYPIIDYQPLDRTTPITLTSNSTVYHVTKEFGPATMGGMGTVLTAITQAQLRTGKITPYVVLPFYSFLKEQEQYPIKKTTTLTIPIRDTKSRLVPVSFHVSELQYDFHPVAHFDRLSDEEKQAIRAEKRPTITVYLIGRGTWSPFTSAFRAHRVTDIYSSPEKLPQEWKDLYFVKATAAFLAWRATGRQEQSLFAPLDSVPRVDTVHLHGATNAFVAHFLRQEQTGPVPPAIVYTMHDYLDELQYTNTIANVKKFMNRPDHGGDVDKALHALVEPYRFHSKRVFMSPLAIDTADAVTFVSETMAKDMVEGRLQVYLKEVMMSNLLVRAENQAFYGISNGLDFSGAINPFTESQLIEAGLDYPTYAQSIIHQKLKHVRDGITNPTLAIQSYAWSFSTQKKDYVIEAKQRAKQFLIDHGLLQPQDIQRPLVLFVGRFQYNKGLETFEAAARLFQQHNMKFVIIGQPNNYPLAWVERLAAHYPDHVVLLKTIEEQRQWLIYVRAAADMVYVPSVTESFGLVAAEGLMFGSSVISTGAGGLSEFLIRRTIDDDAPAPIVSDIHVESRYISNAYLFDRTSQLAMAIERAAADYEQIAKSPLLHEEYVLRMMLSAYSLGWERSGYDQGPVYDYLRVYQQVIQDKKAKSKFDWEGDDLSSSS